MKLIRGLYNLASLPSKLAITIGNFDGVHLGHQAVLQQLQQQADQRHLPSAVVYFEPQPLEYLRPNTAPVRLTPFYEKVHFLAASGVDYLICLKFDHSLAQMSARHFIETLLLQQLRMRYLLVGDDFRFGHQRAGGWELLQQVAELGKFELEKCPVIVQNNVRISSTGIRLALQQADFKQARLFLGRDYSLSGKVRRGAQRGRLLGFPTANLILKHNNLPLSGVFAVMVQLNDNDHYYQGVANLGMRPTVNGDKKNLEVHLFDFNGDLYNQHLRVYFQAKLRAEQHFSSLELLRQQIAMDVNAARTFFLET